MHIQADKKWHMNIFFFTFGTANLHKPVWHNSEMCFGGTLIKLTWQKSDLILKNSAAENQ